VIASATVPLILASVFTVVVWAIVFSTGRKKDDT
jgi:hypothetical protein